jgi:hypothetical protein
MQSIVSLTKQTFQGLLQKVCSMGQEKAAVPAEVKIAIQKCNSMQELLDLLFATDFNKDEAVIALFEKRMEEIDPSF